MALLSQAILDEFDERGYVVVRELLDPETDLKPLVDEYTDLVDSLSEKWFAEGKLPSTYSELPFGERVTQLLKEGQPIFQEFDISLPPGLTKETPIHTGEAVLDLLRHPQVLDAVECFIGPEITCNPVQHVRIKPPERLIPESMSNGLVLFTDWHQDVGVVNASADATEMLSVWIAVTDATPENGCMVFIPGSHKGDIALHCSTQTSREPQGKSGFIRRMVIPKAHRGPNEPVPVPINSGDAILFHRRTIHRSLPNKSDGLRWSLDLRYNPTGQPCGRDWLPGFVARSRARPETELTDARVWTQLWEDTKEDLGENGTPAFFRWKEGDPRCA